MSLIHGSELLKEAINFHRRLELEITIWTCENDDSDIRFQFHLLFQNPREPFVSISILQLHSGSKHFHSPLPGG
uniref:Uncharacterized protein n=1 Tax=Helianthus annuus TaxID=4232 RepID=A0A251T3U4_HELAN